MATELRGAREQAEVSEEATRTEAREAVNKQAEFFKKMRQRFGLSQEEVEALLEEEGRDHERVAVRAAEIRREKGRQRQLAEDAELDTTGWSLETSFRSDVTLCGSTKVIIGFESVRGTRVSFRLCLQSGVMDRLKGWNEDVMMPGQAADDSEPLGVWWIYSEDRRMEIQMQESGMDAVLFNDAYVDLEAHPEVSVLLQALTNVAVRDLWTET